MDKTNLRELSKDRLWIDENGLCEEGFREHVEQALKEGERVMLIWIRPSGTGDVYYMRKHIWKQGPRNTFVELVGVLGKVLHDLYDSLG